YDESKDTIAVKVKRGFLLSYTIDLSAGSSSPPGSAAPDPVHPIKCAADVAVLAEDAAGAKAAAAAVTEGCAAGFGDACLQAVSDFMGVVDTTLGHTATALGDCTDGSDSECNQDLSALVGELAEVSGDVAEDLAACGAREVRECVRDVVESGEDAVQLGKDVVNTVKACRGE
ncbi:hypothetical protein TeGR_g11579, partial [Tetraparma gracilis]